MDGVTVLAATWDDGVVVVQGGGGGAERDRELAGHRVRGLAPDGRGGALALVHDPSGADAAGSHALCRRSATGEWSTLVRDASDLACVQAVGNSLYVGTDGDARLATVVRRDGGSALVTLTGFDETPGRSGWYAGTAVVDGRVVGPPLGVRSLAATAGGDALLAAVHVGGVPRSIDGGARWQPTMDVEHDVHDVCAHSIRPERVAAATAVGLCVSDDAGATWRVCTDGLHATYCSAVAFAGDDILVAASTDHFAREGALYRAPGGEGRAGGPLERVEVGAARWMDGIVDTACLVARGDVVAAVTKGGTLHASPDAGRTWTTWAAGLSATSSILIV